MSIAADLVSTNGDNAELGLNETRLSIVTNTPELAARYEFGSKMFIIGWLTYTSFIWTLKLCMLFLLQRLTQSLWTSKFVKPLMVVAVILWVVIMIILFTLCRPFYRYWQVYPDPGSKHDQKWPNLTLF